MHINKVPLLLAEKYESERLVDPVNDITTGNPLRETSGRVQGELEQTLPEDNTL